MKILEETKQHYFFVMIIEFVFLSCVYWLFFSFGFSSALAYLLFLCFYITSFRFWINILNKKENMFRFATNLVSLCREWATLLEPAVWVPTDADRQAGHPEVLQ